MKNTLLVAAMTLAAATALADGPQLVKSGNRELLNDVKTLTWKCAVKLVKASSPQDVIGYKSNCASLVLNDDSSAQVFADGKWYTAKIQESPQADEGDLDNLQLFNSAGKLVAVRTNVLAFDSVVLALAGGDTYVQSEPSDETQMQMQTEIVP